MTLPVVPPVLPMLAKRVAEIPDQDEGRWVFEPKWDGFRVIVFRDGDELLLQSRDTNPLNRYFPDVVEVLLAQLPERCVLDGEIVIVNGDALDFDALQLRLHPAESRVKMLASQMPASVVFFDLLAIGDRNLMTEPFAVRRRELEKLFRTVRAPLHLTPATGDRAVAADWFQRFEGAGLDGVIAKLRDGLYEPDTRTMLKIKHERECDCVVAGFRWHKHGIGVVGSLLLGLYDGAGSLQHVGVCSSFTAAKRIELAGLLEPYREGAAAGHPWLSVTASQQRIPGGQSRWSQGKDSSWEPLRPELVVEVAYEHMQNGRFRHMSQFRRWRADKVPRECTFVQLEVVPPHELREIFKTSSLHAKG
ncbi:ATP-dependent DNA ligase [Bryobacterales bacterium F-183]|nr:ATP-dependent DNA ligase [Bryobacterales bacterium F-183]